MFYVFAPNLKFSKLPRNVRIMIAAEQSTMPYQNFRSFKRVTAFGAQRVLIVTHFRPGRSEHWNPKFCSGSFQECCDWAEKVGQSLTAVLFPPTEGRKAAPALPEAQTPPAQPS